VQVIIWKNTKGATNNYYTGNDKKRKKKKSSQENQVLTMRRSNLRKACTTKSYETHVLYILTMIMQHYML